LAKFNQALDSRQS